MTDQEILNCHNEIIETMAELRATSEHIAREIPVGKTQVRYSPLSDQWVPEAMSFVVS